MDTNKYETHNDIDNILYYYYLATGIIISMKELNISSKNIKFVKDSESGVNFIEHISFNSKIEKLPKINDLRTDLINTLNEFIYNDYITRNKKIKEIVEKDLLNQHLNNLNFIKKNYNL